MTEAGERVVSVGFRLSSYKSGSVEVVMIMTMMIMMMMMMMMMMIRV